MAETNPKAFPMATGELQKKILDLTALAVNHKQIRKGANEATKVLNKGRAELIVLAGDADPIEIILQLPIICEDKDVPYVFVPSKNALGRAAGVSRQVIAVAILTKDGSPLQSQLNDVRNEVEALLV